MENQITPNPQVPTQIIARLKFPKVINNLGIIPTSYKDSMNYYECLAWLCKYLEETVIPTVNQTGSAVQELQGLYIELNNYVTHYFDNLDVQEEINQKLDDMAEQGTLQEVISSYLNTKAIICFDTVSDLSQAENLINGSYAKTLGFYSINDLGGAIYKIRNLTIDDTVDNITLIELENLPTLVAELIKTDTMNVCQFGVENNVESTLNFQTALNFMEGNKIIIPDITLILNNTITLPDSIDIECLGKIQYSADITYLFQNLSSDCNIKLNGLDIQKMDNSFQNLNRFIYIAHGSLIIENSKFKNCGTAIHCEGKKLIANNITISNVYGTAPQYRLWC